MGPLVCWVAPVSMLGWTLLYVGLGPFACWDTPVCMLVGPVCMIDGARYEGVALYVGGDWYVVFWRTN